MVVYKLMIAFTNQFRPLGVPLCQFGWAQFSDCASQRLLRGSLRGWHFLSRSPLRATAMLPSWICSNAAACAALDDVMVTTAACRK